MLAVVKSMRPFQALTATTGYAIRAMACLAREECAFGNIRTVSLCTGVPAPYLAKVFKRLNAAGLITSKRGPRGGIWLTRAPRYISIADIAEATAAPESGADCLLLQREPVGCGPACPLYSVCIRQQTKLRKKLARIRLSDVVRFITSARTACPARIAPGRKAA